MPVDDVRLSDQQLKLLRWIAIQVGILGNSDPDSADGGMVEHHELARRIERAKDKTIRWSSNSYFGPHYKAYRGVSEAEVSSLSRSLKKLEERGFIKRLGDSRIKLTPAGYGYVRNYFLGDNYPRVELRYKL